MTGATSDITPLDSISTRCDPLTADHPTECREDVPPFIWTATNIDERDQTCMQHLASEGKAPFFKRESLPYSPFKKSETILHMPEMSPYFPDGVVHGQRDLQSEYVYTVEEDPRNDRSYVLEIRRPGSENPLRICNDSNAKDPMFSYEFNNATSGTNIYFMSRPNAPPEETRYCSWETLSTNRNFFCVRQGHQRGSKIKSWESGGVSAEIDTILKRLPPGVKVSRAWETAAAGEASSSTSQ